MIDTLKDFGGIFIAVLLVMIVGTLFYGPSGFGDLWCAAQGIDTNNPESMKMLSNNKKAHIIAVIMYIIMATVIGYLSTELGYGVTNPVRDGLVLACILWMGFALPITGIKSAYNPRSKKILVLLDLTYALAYLLVLCIFILKYKSWMTTQ
mmetsp:Transcript_36448/g.44984  ORF Transcript_36448/g.44984 Transcript_36448/m.44984 type:complete len:151 (-) Transcript_36448:109-561(-)